MIKLPTRNTAARRSSLVATALLAWALMPSGIQAQDLAENVRLDGPFQPPALPSVDAAPLAPGSGDPSLQAPLPPSAWSPGFEPATPLPEIEALPELDGVERRITLFARDPDPSWWSWALGEDDGLGWFSLESKGILGFGRKPGFSSSSGGHILWLEGPIPTDLPPRLFGFHYGLRWREQNGCWGYEIAAAPGVYSDFEDSARGGFRVQGHGFGIYAPQPGVQWLFGVQYLDRADVKLLPVAGVILIPNPSIELELVFPTPRIARLMSTSESSERWLYLAGELGGDSWAIERTTGLADLVTLTEYRIALGIETLETEADASFLELVYTYHRQLRFSSGLGDFNPADTFMLRVGTRF